MRVNQGHLCVYKRNVQHKMQRIELSIIFQSRITYLIDRALDSKSMACTREMVSYAMKAGRNFTAEFSAAAFELFKRLFLKHVSDMNTDTQSQLVCTPTSRDTDKTGAVVSNVYCVSNKRADGTAGKQVKYSIHL